MKSFKRSVLVFGDGQNVSIPDHNQEIIQLVKSYGEIGGLWAYHDWRSLSSKVELVLHESGWSCVDVPVKKKNEVDYRIIKDCRRLCRGSYPDVVALIGGDKDYASLVKSLIHAGKQVVVIGRRGNMSHQLQKLVPNDVYFVETLCLSCAS